MHLDKNVYILDGIKLTKRIIGRIITNGKEDKDSRKFKNKIKCYILNKQIIIKTNLSQEQWNKFCEGELSDFDLEKYA